MNTGYEEEIGPIIPIIYPAGFLRELKRCLKQDAIAYLDQRPVGATECMLRNQPPHFLQEVINYTLETDSSNLTVLNLLQRLMESKRGATDHKVFVRSRQYASDFNKEWVLVTKWVETNFFPPAIQRGISDEISWIATMQAKAERTRAA